MRLTRCAQNSAKIHDSLIVERRAAMVQHLIGKQPERFAAGGGIDRCLNPEIARQDPIDIPVKYCVWKPESNAGNGSSRIVPHSLQKTDRVIVAWEDACLCYLLRSSMQVTGPAIVAQPLPKKHHFIFTGGCQTLYIRETADESVVIVYPLRHLSLLQDDFGKPDAIGVASLPPGKLPPMPGIPLF